LRGDNRFLAIVGPSGSGKSSLVRAGLVAALERGEVEAWLAPGHQEAVRQVALWLTEPGEGTEDTWWVEDAARQWARERDDSLLYRGLQLEKALEWQKRRT
jgi:energy-coupling factor transporter ATP-binding protein EcfA2